MIKFNPIRIDDRAIIERYTMSSDVTNCDLAFANMYCWQEVFRSAWAEIEGFLVIRFQIDGGEKIGYMQPVGDGDFSSIVPILYEDAHAHGQPLRIIGLTAAGCELIRARYAGMFAFDSDPAFSDYIYSTDDLRNLSGRKFQAKRNHINRFIAAYPNYRYEELRREHFDECMRLEREWRRGHAGHTSELCAEQRAMQRAFVSFEELGMMGGSIYVGDRMVAFTYGSAVNDHTFDTHVEKADTEYDGAFAAINKFFAERLPLQFTQINREEDLGLEGLRKAKRSYQPIEITPKFTAVQLDSEEVACKRLWMTAFGDEERFVDEFLIRYYNRRQMLAIESEGELVAMLHLIPFESELGHTTYIYGVATDPACRHQGLATRLMQEAVRLIDERGDDAAVLIPTPDQTWLPEFYAKFGFGASLPILFETPDGFDFGTGNASTDRAMVRQRENSSPLPENLRCRYVGE